MKYQDSTCEHAFWKQLLEMYDEWKDCDMVGTISSNAYKKIGLDRIDYQIKTKKLWAQNGWKYFMDSSIHPNNAPKYHPHLLTIMNDVAKTLNVPLVTEAYCTFLMCRPAIMLEFIEWVEHTLKPTVLSHPLIMTDAKYPGALSKQECIERFGIPYYPHVPFVLERMTKIFFVRRDVVQSLKDALAKM
jgi:hypothetical protein